MLILFFERCRKLTASFVYQYDHLDIGHWKFGHPKIYRSWRLYHSTLVSIANDAIAHGVGATVSVVACGPSTRCKPNLALKLYPRDQRFGFLWGITHFPLEDCPLLLDWVVIRRNVENAPRECLWVVPFERSTICISAPSPALLIRSYGDLATVGLGKCREWPWFVQTHTQTTGR